MIYTVKYYRLMKYGGNNVDIIDFNDHSHYFQFIQLIKTLLLIFRR